MTHSSKLENVNSLICYRRSFNLSQLPGSGGDDSLYGILSKHLKSRTSEFSASESSTTYGDNFADRMTKCPQELEMYDSASTSNRYNPLKKYDLVDENFKSRDTLQSLVQSSFACRHKPECCQMAFMSSRKHLLQNKSATKISWRDNQVGKDSFSSQLIKPCFECQVEKKPHQSPTNESICVSSSNVTLETSKKRRITWTDDLHKQFSECVYQLGGAKKATPKAILKLMNCDGLTISNIKSHLQKYRVTCDVTISPKDKNEGSHRTSSLPAHAPTTYPQIWEALKLQISVQQTLQEQLEIQRSLQLRIEEQAKQLREMLNRQAESKKNPQHST
ncbi:protein PHOSPHATE STARVATION RESPONSE 3-like isoform X2 [Lycium ferocissimum]|uniref:protein PHOSPHATE STARVATION RESPONSE 3-like isoform X2 n=1 Tax=Lycium ferocissimum TaxID=112874 RepID=UPI00281665EF|nr:protein PHOSPHATE STARVATION RESPONSE 3-like isoform X2 [Lycium ferocissimum]